MGGYDPTMEKKPVKPEPEKEKEEGLMTKLGKAAKKKSLGLVAAAGVALSAESAGAQDKGEWWEKDNAALAQKADQAQAELGSLLEEDRAAEKQAVDEYTTLVDKYYSLRTDLSEDKKRELRDNTIDYASDVFRGKSKKDNEVLKKVYNDAMKKNINDLQKKTKTSKK